MPIAPERCPKCSAAGTMEMISEKKGGFSGGKAIAGAVIFGPVGVVGGALGKRIVVYKCTSCGYIVEK